MSIANLTNIQHEEGNEKCGSASVVCHFERVGQADEEYSIDDRGGDDSLVIVMAGRVEEVKGDLEYVPSGEHQQHHHDHFQPFLKKM